MTWPVASVVSVVFNVLAITTRSSQRFIVSPVNSSVLCKSTVLCSVGLTIVANVTIDAGSGVTRGLSQGVKNLA